jgi:5'-phosphate synthase pdxT subunit
LPSAAGKATRSPRVGVLSLQGDFDRHRATLEALAVEAVRVTLPRDLENLDAMILPGGESTTMLRLLETTGLREPLGAFVRARPTLGTCAGVILLARESSGLPASTFGVLDIAVERNAYGRQIDSFSAEVEPSVFGGPYLGVFIRAPRIRRVGAGVEVVAWRRSAPETSGGRAAPTESEPVGVRSRQAVGLCFHPELTHDLRFHRWFLSDVANLTLPEATASLATREDAA